MPIIKVEASADFIQKNGGIPKIGDSFQTDQGELGVVAMSFPELDDPNMLVQVPDVQHALGILAFDPSTVNQRNQHEDYGVLWIGPRYSVADVGSAYAVGDTFEPSGATEVVRAAANYGAGIFAFCCDTGVDATHDAFAGKSLKQWSRSDPNAAVDQHGHGTFVLSQLGGAYGVLSDAAIGMFQALEGPSGMGSELTVSTAFRAAADYVRSLGNILAVGSFSLGGSKSSVIQAGMQYILQLPNIIVFCAAGNDGATASIGSPADTPNNTGRLFVVGAVDRENVVASFSTGGTRNGAISMYQYGVDIVAAAKGTGNQFMTSSGTSMSTPNAAGLGGCHLVKQGSVQGAIALLNTNRQHQLNPPAQNGKGVLQLAQEDFITADGGGNGGNGGGGDGGNGGGSEPPADTTIQTVIGNLEEANNQMNTVRFRDDPPPTVQEMQSVMGIAVEYNTQSIALLHTVPDPGPEPPGPGEGNGPGTDPPDPGPLPPPAPSPGLAGTIHYGPGQREYFNILSPKGSVGWPLMVLWHGGGWLQGDPGNAIPLMAPLFEQFGIRPEETTITAEEIIFDTLLMHVMEVQSWFTQQRLILCMPAYDYGVSNAIVDAKAAVKYIVAHALQYGADPAKLYLSGHSAGGHLALMCASDPAMPMPHGVVGLAAAGVYVDATTRIPPASQQIFNMAWGTDRSQWAQYSPHSHLNDRPGPKPQNVTLIQGARDDQLDPNWAVNYVSAAKRAGWGCDINMQAAGDHFSVANPARNPTTAQIITNTLQR